MKVTSLGRVNVASPVVIVSCLPSILTALCLVTFAANNNTGFDQLLRRTGEAKAIRASPH
jgi:hypothetical protein